MTFESLRAIVLGVIAAGLAIILHELAHGFAALALGDHTAARAGRLSLNPLSHIDRYGTIVVPLVLLISQLVMIGRVAFMFGWAKPVPVDARQFTNPRRGMALVAAAGPVMNFFLALVGAFGLAIFGTRGASAIFFADFVLFNVVLGLFNLIPLPPFDGGRIAVGVLPMPLARALAKVERVGILAILLAIFVLPGVLGAAGIKFDPVGSLLNTLVPAVAEAILAIAGVHGARF